MTHRAPDDSPDEPTRGRAGGTSPWPGRVPPWQQLRNAVSVAAYVFVADLVAGVTGHGIDLEHWSNSRIAAESALAALLAGLGYGAVSAARHHGPSVTPTASR